MLSRIRVCEKWRVCYSPTIVAVSLPRKVAELRPHMDRGRQTGVARTDQSYIQSIEHVGEELTVCVAAESFNRMMLTGQHMVPLRTAGVPGAPGWCPAGVTQQRRGL